jgi:hypothetical protein
MVLLTLIIFLFFFPSPVEISCHPYTGSTLSLRLRTTAISQEQIKKEKRNEATTIAIIGLGIIIIRFTAKRARPFERSENTLLLRAPRDSFSACDGNNTIARC